MTLVLQILLYLFELYSYALIIYILLTWVPGARESTFGDFLARICEPYLEPFRRFIPPLGVIDISPIVAILVLRFASSGLVRIFEVFLR
ncbi:MULTISPECIES: YggT family protein [unclassified Bacillus (in: firmicutes)]|uniref:YggT family protein n=1 Tax=unclassified Bacillus (in: firmicutes) TaxID=185979 RepID=UPI0008EEA581|nr:MULTISPECIES: YggT family protein [unclassified Bacillus (in: firmicutes)]SFI61557.1 YggT family protein [Bacillus sp. 71mf]SFS43875.1 YggT family protein [Bacillus sp. 103mf]